MTTSRKTAYTSDGLSSVRYTPAAMDEDPEDMGSDSSKLAFISSCGAPLNGDVVRTLSTSTTTSPPASATSAAYPYYDFQDTDENESEGGGCDIGIGGGGGGGGNGGGGGVDYPYSPSHTQHPSQQSLTKDPFHNNNHSNHNHHNHVHSNHNSLEKDHMHSRNNSDMRDFRDLSKSPLSLSRRRRGGKGRCMCCMMCVFLLSTAGLGAVLLLIYAGKVELVPSWPENSSHANGGCSIDRLEDQKVQTDDAD
nr:hypothetical protein BaRGS_015059 [Batillaria attramentaria]